MLQDTKIVNERRLVIRLQSYWDTIRQQDPLPDFNKFNQNSIPDIWDSCMLFKVSDAGNKKMYQCAYVGRQLIEGFGKDLENRYVSLHDKRMLPGSNIVEFLEKTIESKSVMLSQGQFVNHQNKIVKYRDCILPFSDRTGKIKQLVVGISWRAFG